MNDNNAQIDGYRSLLLLDEISKNDALTQRDLSKKLGVALGLVNSYIKNLVSKGFITVAAIPKKRYKYYLTPHGFAEKTRLTYQHLQNFTGLYRVARRDFQALFSAVESSDLKKIVFCGVDEITEIAYISLAETGLTLVAVIDATTSANRVFLGHMVLTIEDIRAVDYDLVVITSFHGGYALRSGLLAAGVDDKKICDISAEGWLKKIEARSNTTLVANQKITEGL